MDKKDLEESVAKNGKDDDIIYGENKPQEPMFVKEARTVAYSVDEEIEYQKYLKLPEMMHAEFIDGKIIYLGEPSRKHQELSMTLSTRFNNYLHGKTCEVYAAPFGVKIDFESDPNSRTTLQPDLLIICDKKKLDEKGLNGAPDLVIEILSPTNLSHDRVFKYSKYLSVGVKEYWLVDPMNEEINVNVLVKNRYISKTYKKGDIIKVSIFDDFSINVTDLFDGRAGDEIVEVEVAREEEREKADAERVELLEQAAAEKSELLQANARKMIEDGLSVEMIERYTGLSAEEINTILQ